MSNFCLKDYDRRLKEQKDINLLTMLIYGEARGEHYDGKVAVAWVVMNRYRDSKKRFGKSFSDVILKEKQFSCFNPDDPNLVKITNPNTENFTEKKVWADCYLAATRVYLDMVNDPTNGATHYLVRNCKPSWRKRLTETITIGNHVFLK